MLNRLVFAAGTAAAVALTALTALTAGTTLDAGRGGHRAVDPSVWDSVYTAQQAARGDTLYSAGCVKCHGATLAGGDDGTPLAGDDFMSNWDGLMLDELYSQIRKSMPPDNPNSIPREQVPDLIAFILSKNGFPAGTKPLSAEADSLKTIKIAKTKP